MKPLETKNEWTPKALLIVAAMAGLVFFTSCDRDDIEKQFDEPEAEAMESESIAQSDFDEVDDITANVMGVAEVNAGGRVAGVDDERCHCAEITHDKENKTITIDFGDGCKGPNGVVRSGIIFITYDGHRFVPGSYWTITFRNYYVNRRHIEGLRTVTNISESLQDDPTFHITLQDGKITWPDETFATREVDKVRVWVRASNPLLDEHHILVGSVANGMNRRGVAYKTEVLRDLIYKRNCRASQKIRIPVQGVKQIQTRQRNCMINYGDGTCDAEVEITCGDDPANTMDLAERG